MIGGSRAADPSDGDFVAFRQAGEAVQGEYRCSECGYGVSVARELPMCPMCSGTLWEEAAWSPVGRRDRIH